MVNNQATILENQGKGLPIVNDTNQKINDIDDRLIDLAQKVD